MISFQDVSSDVLYVVKKQHVLEGGRKATTASTWRLWWPFVGGLVRGSMAASCCSDCESCGHSGKLVPVPSLSMVGPGASKWRKCAF